MAALYLTLLVVLLGAIKEVSEAAGDLGEACLSGNTCIDDTNLVCESNVCLFKAGMTCFYGVDKCVSHTTCTSFDDQCTCDATYSNNGGLCAVIPNTYGGACTAPSGGTDSCVANDANSKCSGTSGTCGCKTNYSGSIGAKCALIPNTYGGACTSPSEGTDSCVATDANSKCSQATEGTCGCKTNYSGSIGATCAVIPNTYGGACTAPSGGTDSCVANDANSKCSGTSGTCVCKTYYSGSIGATCAVIPNTYGGACTAPSGGTDSCVANDANSKCSGTSGTCVCKTYYSGSIGATCAVIPNTYGGACTSPSGGTDSCVATDANSKCSQATGGTCGCKTNYSGSIGGTCAVIPNTYGGACTAPSGGTDSCVANDANSKCSGTTGTCGCKTGFTASIGKLCSGAMGIAGSLILLISALLIKIQCV